MTPSDDFILSDSDRAAIVAQLRQAMGRGVRIPNEQLPTSLQLTEGAYTGLLVALWLDDATAAALAQPGGEPAENLHITLAIVPDMATADDLTFARIVGAVDDIAAYHAPLTGTIGGHGRFYGGDDGDVIYAVPDVPGLTELRGAIVDSIGFTGAAISREHGYSPHITLAYVPAGTDLTPDLAELPLRFTDIVIVAGERRVVIPLRGMTDGMVYAESISDHAGIRFVRPRTFTAASEWVQFLPPPGTYTHAVFGTLDFTAEKYAAIVANFSANTYGQDLPINVEHDYRSAGAVGWIREMRLAEDGSIEVRPEWNDRGRELIAGDRFRYVSAEIYDQWQDPVTADFHDNVAVGMAICVRPHFKTDVLRPLAASETGTLDDQAGRDAHRQEGTGVSDAKNQQPPAAGQAVTLTEAEIREYRELKPKYEATVTELAEAKTTIAAQEGRIASLETAQRSQRFTALVKGTDGGPRWFGDAGEHVAMLNDLAATFGEDSEQVKRYIKTNTEHAKSVAQSGLFSAAGTSAGGDGDAGKSAWQRVEEQAKVYAEANKVTQQQAITHILTTDRELATAVAKERN
jgi:2'-5' RNA ligase